MTKALGYYTSYTPDDSLLEEMKEAWGTGFQSLSNVERAWMMAQIAENLCADFCGQAGDDSVRPGVEQAVTRIQNDELTIGDQIRLIEALANQIGS